MEKVLEVYVRLHDSARPLVCLDETSRQLIRETRIPLPHGPGREARVDYEYERAGVVNLFMLFAPLEGWREVSVRDRRTAFDYAQGNRLNKPLTRLYFLNRGVRAHLFFRRFRMSCTPNDSTAPAFLTHFQAVEDPRQEGEVLYPLEEILLLVLCGVISGADGWTSIALYGQKKLELLRRFLPYENGTPSHDQLGILFSRLDMEVFQSCFISWVASLNETLEGVVAADGKTLRRSFDTSSSRAAIHMVSAWACDQKLVLGQRKVDDKSNEITAIPELLELLKIKGAIVAIDAMGCQRKICKNPVIKRRIM